MPYGLARFWSPLVATLCGVAIFGGVAGASGERPRSTPAAAVGPIVTVTSPGPGASYELGASVRARFTCSAGQSAIASCQGTVAPGHALNTASVGPKSFTVTARDADGNAVSKTVNYTVWAYVNPLRAVADLQASRIDMGVDYSGSGPILALGKAQVVLASDRLAGPESCWGKTCVPPPGDMIVYRLLDGPFAGKYVYVVEHITIRVKPGETVSAGATIAILHEGSPNLEVGWASGYGAETLAAARGQKCSCRDPGGWSSIEGRNFDQLLVWLGAPSGYVTTAPPQRMPRGWPMLPPGPPPSATRDGASSHAGRTVATKPVTTS